MQGINTSRIEAFRSRFTFAPPLVGHVGVERECFIVDNQGTIVPRAPELLNVLEKHDPTKRFGYELSASQIEGHTGPCRVEELEEQLEEGDRLLQRGLNELGLNVSYVEVAPSTMPLDVFPDPTGRYATIVEKMPKRVLLAACRIIGTHVHVGMPNHEIALNVYNRVIRHCDELIALGDNSCGERLRIYHEVKPDCLPKRYENWLAFHRIAVKEGFEVDLRNCWSLIRISKFGTIEGRMFGASPLPSRVVHWARTFHNLCMTAMV